MDRIWSVSSQATDECSSWKLYSWVKSFPQSVLVIIHNSFVIWKDPIMMNLPYYASSFWPRLRWPQIVWPLLALRWRRQAKDVNNSSGWILLRASLSHPVRRVAGYGENLPSWGTRRARQLCPDLLLSSLRLDGESVPRPANGGAYHCIAYGSPRVFLRVRTGDPTVFPASASDTLPPRLQRLVFAT